MSQNCNINMKKFNGTDYDGLLPLAYNALNSENSALLEGKSFDEVYQYSKQYTDELNGNVKILGSYIGDGRIGENQPVSLTFDFYPVAVFIARNDSNHIFFIRECSIATASKGYSPNVLWFSNGLNWSYNGISGNDVLNGNGTKYYFVAFCLPWSSVTEFIIKNSRNFTVRRTGRYMLELYGGGGSCNVSDSFARYAGGSSCQHYDSINLVERDIIPVTIGLSNPFANGGETIFGDYRVAGGTVGTSDTAGKGAGNYGKDGSFVQANQDERIYNRGIFGQHYGVGSSSWSVDQGQGASDGVIYLKYLGV